MAIEDPALMRIYTDQDALVGDRSLVEEIVRRARAAGITGATVLQGRMGYGHSSGLHEHRPFELRDNLPVVIEIVEEQAKLRAFLEPLLTSTEDIGLVTIEKVEVLHHGSLRHAPSR